MADEDTGPKEVAKKESPDQPSRKKSYPGLKIAIAVIVILIVIVLASFLTLSVEPGFPAEPDALYPYTVTYDVLLPEGQLIQIAGTPIIVLTAGDELLMKIGDNNEKFVVGQTKTISEHRAVFRVLGIDILSTNYRIDATYRGLVGDHTDFYLIVRTSREVPSFLIQQILPREIQARPV